MEKRIPGKPTAEDRDRDVEHGVPSCGECVSRGQPTQETSGEQWSERRRPRRMPRRGALRTSYCQDPLKVEFESEDLENLRTSAKYGVKRM